MYLSIMPILLKSSCVRVTCIESRVCVFETSREKCARLVKDAQNACMRACIRA
jgi:hypothetical protein